MFRRCSALLSAQFEGYAQHLRNRRLSKFLEKHGQLSDWKSIQASLQCAVNDGVAVSESTLVASLRALSTAGRFDLAKDTFDRKYDELRVRRGIRTYNEILAAAAQAAQSVFAVSLLKRLLSQARSGRATVRITTSMLNCMLESAVRSGKPESALELYEQLRRPPKATRMEPIEIDSDTVRLLSCLAQLGRDAPFALRLIKGSDQMNLPILPETYDRCAATCFAANRFDQVVELVRRMLSCGLPPHEATVRMGMYAIEVMCSRQRDATPPEVPLLCCTLLDALEQNGLPLLPQTFETALRACAVAGQWQPALQVVEEMKRASQPVDPALYELIVASRMSSCASFAEAERLFHLPIVRPNTRSFNALLRCALSTKAFPEFYKTRAKMRRREVSGDVETESLLMEAAFEMGKFEETLRRFCVLRASFEEDRALAEKREFQRTLGESYSELYLSPAKCQMIRIACGKVGRQDSTVRSVLKYLDKYQGRGEPPLLIEAHPSSLATPEEERPPTWFIDTPD